MLTTCPHCQAWFRVRAEHLTAANGVVTCGRCERVFSALASLVDESTFAAVEPVARRGAVASPVATNAEPEPRPEATVELESASASEPVPVIVPAASELRADQAETASPGRAGDDVSADPAADDAAAAIQWEDDAPLPPPAETPWAADAPDAVVEAAGQALESAIESVPRALAVPDDAAAAENTQTAMELAETVVARFVPPAASDELAVPTVTGASDRDGSPVAAAVGDLAASLPYHDAENLETVVTRLPAVARSAADPATASLDTAAPDLADDPFTPGATAFTRAYAAFEDSDTHGEHLEFVFDDDLDATLHMARPDLRVDPVPKAAPAADDAPASMVFDLAEPEDTPPPVATGAGRAPAPANAAEVPTAIATDAALDFDRLDPLPRPVAPADEEPLSALLPEDDVVFASLLDDPALSPEARAALTATLAAEADVEADVDGDGELVPAPTAATSGAPVEGLDPSRHEAAADTAVGDGFAVHAEPAQASAALPAAGQDESPAATVDAPRTGEVAPAPVVDDADDADVPAALADDLRALEAPRRARQVGWTVFALMLALLGLGQAGFVARERLLTWMPAAAPAIDFLCARLPCAERRVEGAVRLLARDVREHPQYRDALLVNATIVNSGTVPTPYPVIDLRLRDAAGNVLAARQFQPGEYLDQSIDQAQGMPAGRPIYVVLELAGDARAAVSFEFTFL